MENTEKKVVLVVDDDESLRFVLVDKLSQSGFEAVGAVDGEEGLKTALEIHPNIILLDLLMPKMGGWEVLEKLRADWGKKAHVIVLTGIESLENVAKGAENGVLGYIVKSKLSLDEIVKQIEGALNK